MESACTSIVVMLDPSCDVQSAIETAVNNLPFSDQDELTIISILPTSCEKIQHSTIAQVTTILQSLQKSMHSATTFNIFAVPETTCLFEQTVRKLVLSAQPHLMILALSPFYSDLVHANIRKSNSLSQITVRHLDSFDSIVPDKENEGWCIQGSPRCSSPTGWD